MTEFLVALALLAQSADAATICQNLQRGFHEANPLLGSTCTQITTRKAVLLGASFVLYRHHKAAWAIAMTTAGGVGITINLAAR